MSIISALPYTLTNGSTADATQVMANFNQIVNNVNANGAANGANSDITSITGLSTPLAASEGGTGQTTDLIPSGTIMLFQQTTSPTSWTKITTSNDVALRVVSGTVGSGGATAFTSVFGSSINTGSHAITQAELPNVNFTVTDTGHKHTRPFGNGTGGLNPNGGITAWGDTSAGNILDATATTGITVASGGSGTAHLHTMSMNLSYIDVILASKN